jgi:transcriptional regulator with XRE-family HTH domain
VTGEPKPLFDTVFVRGRMHALGLSRRALQRACGFTERTLLSFERGENHQVFPARDLLALAEALAVDPAQLLLRAEPEAPQPDDIRLEAALRTPRIPPKTRTVRHALGMSEAAFEDALDKLRRRLAGTGTAVVAHGEGAAALVPRAGVLTTAEIDALERPLRAASELPLVEARLLKRIVDGDGDPEAVRGRANRAGRIALGSLENQRLIRHNDARRYEPTADVRFSLGLTDLPPRRRKPQ